MTPRIADEVKGIPGAPICSIIRPPTVGDKTRFIPSAESNTPRLTPMSLASTNLVKALATQVLTLFLCKNNLILPQSSKCKCSRPQSNDKQIKIIRKSNSYY